MGRSNKEAREGGAGLTHSGYDTKRGHGGMKRNRTMGMASGQSIRPQGETEGSGMKRAKAAAQARASAGGAGGPPRSEADDMMDADAGWDAIGKAGASIADTYVTRRKAKKTSGGGVPA